MNCAPCARSVAIAERAAFSGDVATSESRAGPRSAPSGMRPNTPMDTPFPLKSPEALNAGSSLPRRRRLAQTSHTRAESAASLRNV